MELGSPKNLLNSFPVLLLVFVLLLIVLNFIVNRFGTFIDPFYRPAVVITIISFSGYFKLFSKVNHKIIASVLMILFFIVLMFSNFLDIFARYQI